VAATPIIDSTNWAGFSAAQLDDRLNIGAKEIQQKSRGDWVGWAQPGQRSVRWRVLPRGHADDVGPTGPLAGCRPGFVAIYPIRLVARSQKSV
jgi:hypothetical protein